MPLSCCSNDMNTASISYELVQVLLEWLKFLLMLMRFGSTGTLVARGTWLVAGRISCRGI